MADGAADASADRSRETGWTLCGMAAWRRRWWRWGCFKADSLARLLTRATEIVRG
jgi:hypothetical protein